MSTALLRAVSCRGSASFSKHISIFARKRNLALHDTLLLERRGTKGVGLYVRDACDSGTSLLVIPNSGIVSSHSVTSSSFPFYFAGNETPGIIASLLGCKNNSEWVELSWRIALEKCNSQSTWWGWLDSLPSEVDFHDDIQNTVRCARAHFPFLVSGFMGASEKIEAEIEEAYDDISESCVVPSLNRFKWATRVVLSRSSRVVIKAAEGTIQETLGFVPIYDFANCPTMSSFCYKYHTTSVECSDHDGIVRELRSSHLLGRRGMFVNPSEVHPSATLEVALEVSELPRWYRDASSDTSSTLLEASFPFLVLTLAKDMPAGEEVTVPYILPQTVLQESSVLYQWADDPKEMTLMAMWLRYMFSPF
eukprot:Tbor_TRINITY_DN5565_c0_g1::TRINITY_DN5565_c0_g1_i1::g.13599::m.13599